MFIRGGEIHNRPIADMHIHTTANTALAAQGLDGTVFNRCVYVHCWESLISSSIYTILKANLPNIQGWLDCQQGLPGA
jgi:hypothetical protein